MTDQEPIPVEAFKALVIKHGDKVVVSVPGVLTTEQHERIRFAWRQFAGEGDDATPMLLLDGGVTLSVLRAGPAEG